MKRFAIASISLVGCLIAWACWHYLPHVNATSDPMTYSEFAKRFLSSSSSHEDARHAMLMPAASNIYFATSSAGLGGRSVCYRHNAPLSNMLEFITFLDNIGTRKREKNEPPPYTLLSVPVQRPNMRLYGLHRLDWFDVDCITNGFVSHAGDPRGTIWVDADRELYYSYWTD